MRPRLGDEWGIGEPHITVVAVLPLFYSNYPGSFELDFLFCLLILCKCGECEALVIAGTPGTDIPAPSRSQIQFMETLKFNADQVTLTSHEYRSAL